jgi:tetratricopeptide (TPR) repeat protein
MIAPLSLTLLLAVAPPIDRNHNPPQPDLINATSNAAISSAVESTVSDKLTTKYETMLNEAKAADDQVREQLKLVLDAISTGLVILGTVISILVAWGFSEIAKVKKTRKDAENLTRDVNKYILSQVKLAIERDWAVLGPLLDQLPPISDEDALVNAPPRVIQPEQALAYQEADSLIVLGDKLNAISDPENASGYFVKLAHYWWAIHDWPRAASRSKRAIEISPTSPQAYWEYGAGALNRASVETDMALKLSLLRDSERCILTAQRLKIEDDSGVSYKLGCIYDTREDHDSAISCYKQALEDKNLPGQKRAKYGYNLACSLSKAGALQEAIAVLRPIIAQEKNWLLAQEDPDFDNLRNSDAAKLELGRLIQAGRMTATGS